MSYLDYYAYGHGNAPTEPVGDETSNIIGIELEIAEILDTYEVEDLIENGILGVPDYEAPYIQLEEEDQHNVAYELIFNADAPEVIIDRIRNIDHIQSAISNHHETSCHIHINRYWLENVRDISEVNYLKATEAVAPIIYAVSGRDSHSVHWCKTQTNYHAAPDDIDRWEAIDELTPETGDRYMLTNCRNSNTIEIRGFSNYYELETDLIAFYIAIADELIPAIADAMKGKTYSTSASAALEVIGGFLADYPHYVERFNLQTWADNADALRRLRRYTYERAIRRYNRFMQELNDAEERLTWGTAPEALEKIAGILRRFNFVHLETINMDNLDAALHTLEEQAQKHFKNTVWRI